MGVALPFPSETFLSGRDFVPPSENFRKKFSNIFRKSCGVPEAPEKNVPKALQDNTKKFPFSKIGYNSFETPDPPFQWHRKKEAKFSTTLKPEKQNSSQKKNPDPLGFRGGHPGTEKSSHRSGSPKEQGQ
jgi:hypothetical protein